jgi:hypothetical protein
LSNDYFEGEIEGDKDDVNVCDYCFWMKRVSEFDPPCMYCKHYEDKKPPSSYDYQKQLRLYKTKLKDKRM